MCTTVVDLDGQWIDGVAAMNERGWTVTDADWDGDPPILLSTCLCPVDVEAILERHGVAYTDDGSGFLDVTAPTVAPPTAGPATPAEVRP